MSRSVRGRLGAQAPDAARRTNVRYRLLTASFALFPSIGFPHDEIKGKSKKTPALREDERILKADFEVSYLSFQGV